MRFFATPAPWLPRLLPVAVSATCVLLVLPVAVACILADQAHALQPPPLAASWGSWGSGPGQFSHPWDAAVAPNGNVYVSDYANHRIQYFTPTGEYLGEWGGGTGRCPDGFFGPQGIAIDPDGFVYVMDPGNCVRKFTAAGQFVSGFSDEHIRAPRYLALDQDGNIYVANGRPAPYTITSTVSKFDPAGTFLMEFPSLHAMGVYVDAQGYVFVTNFSPNDPSQRVIQKFSSDGVLVAQSTNGGECISVESYDIVGDEAGNVIVADRVHGILLYSRDLVCLSSWMIPPPEFPPDSESLAQGLALDRNGDLYVTELNGCRVLKYRYAPPVAARASTWGQLKAAYR